MTRPQDLLRVGTTEEESGRVHLREYVATEQETITMPVRKERAVLKTATITEGNVEPPSAARPSRRRSTKSSGTRSGPSSSRPSIPPARPAPLRHDITGWLRSSWRSRVIVTSRSPRVGPEDLTPTRWPRRHDHHLVRRRDDDPRRRAPPGRCREGHSGYWAGAARQGRGPASPHATWPVWRWSTVWAWPRTRARR